MWSTDLPPCHQFNAYHSHDDINECYCRGNSTYYFWQPSLTIGDDDKDDDGYLGCWNETNLSK